MNFEDRYAGNWSTTRTKALRLTRGRCVICDFPATEVHHARYATNVYQYIDKQCTHLIPNRGCEVPLSDVFPLCDTCHTTKAHHKNNWIEDKDNPVLLNRNTKEFYNHLLLAAKRFLPKEPTVTVLPPQAQLQTPVYQPIDKPVRYPLFWVYFLIGFVVLLICLL